MGWSFNSERPIFLQIADRIRSDIICARYGPGDKIPSVRELAAEASVNPNTMQRALTELETAGLVTAQRTAGRFVTQDPGVILASRDALARELTAEYLSRLEKLCCGPADVPELIKSITDRARNGKEGLK